MNKKVSIERCSSYDPHAVYTALKRAVELSGGLDVSGKTVLLKPNILSDTPPEKAVITHPVFLETSIRLVREMGAKRILVGDSPGIQVPGFTAKISGLGETVKKNGAEWVDFTREKTEILFPGGQVMKKFTVTRAVREADIIINLPKLKTHQLMYFTGAVKNLFGLMPSLVKSPLHARFPSREAFAAMLVDLNLAVNPAYSFMDAIVGMEGPGPGSGTPRNVGLVLASPNLLAMDTAASFIIGYPPGEIPTNREALSRGFWLSNFEEIEYPGLSPADVRIPDFIKVPLKRSGKGSSSSGSGVSSGSQLLDFMLPPPLRRFKDSFAPGPEIDHSVCVRCGDCVRICASRAMSFAGEGKESQVFIDYRRCIRCFCCHEICGVKAIAISERKPGNSVRG